MLKLYTQNNCQYCSILAQRLKEWGITFETINIMVNDEGKKFLKERGHTYVPQLYLSDFNLNRGINTLDFTEKVFYDKLDEFIDSHSKEQVDEIIKLYDRNKDKL